MVPTTMVVASAKNFPEHRAAGMAHKTWAPQLGRAGSASAARPCRQGIEPLAPALSSKVGLLKVRPVSCAVLGMK